MGSTLFFLWSTLYILTCVVPDWSDIEQHMQDYWDNQTNAARHPECPAITSLYRKTYGSQYVTPHLRCVLWTREDSNMTKAIPCLYEIARMTAFEYNISLREDPFRLIRCTARQNALDELEYVNKSTWYCRALSRRILSNAPIDQ